MRYNAVVIFSQVGCSQLKKNFKAKFTKHVLIDLAVNIIKVNIGFKLCQQAKVEQKVHSFVFLFVSPFLRLGGGGIES